MFGSSKDCTSGGWGKRSQISRTNGFPNGDINPPCSDPASFSIQRFDQHPQSHNSVVLLSWSSYNHKRLQWHLVWCPPQQKCPPTLDGLPHRECAGVQADEGSNTLVEAWECDHSPLASAKVGSKSLCVLTFRLDFMSTSYYCFFRITCLLNICMWKSLPIWYKQSAGQTDEKNWRGQGGCTAP